MTRIVSIPKYPECWETCGNCGHGDVLVDTVHVAPGDKIRTDDPLITLETGKVALDIPSPCDGVILDVLVTVGEAVTEGRHIVAIDPS